MGAKQEGIQTPVLSLVHFHIPPSSESKAPPISSHQSRVLPILWCEAAAIMDSTMAGTEDVL